MNTIFAKKEMIRTTNSYNYIYTNDNFYLYTGLTSIGNDESIVGVVLSDAKTKETNFYKLGGATERAAKQSAEGEVQDLKYSATDPILINYLGEPTYFMMLKDKEGLVKKYAYVNVAQYQMVGIGDTINQAQVNYNQILNFEAQEETELTINEIIPVVNDGTTYYYITFMEEEYKDVYMAHISISKDLPFMKAGDTVQVNLSEDVVISIK